jgi:hypothetical protein
MVSFVAREGVVKNADEKKRICSRESIIERDDETTLALPPVLAVVVYERRLGGLVRLAELRHLRVLLRFSLAFSVVVFVRILLVPRLGLSRPHVHDVRLVPRHALEALELEE